MEEKKQIKISLGTAISIGIILILILALAVTIIYYNKNTEEENTIKSDNVQKIEEEEDNIYINKKYIFSSSNENEEIYPEFQEIGFSSDDKFVIETTMFTVTGQCELTDNNIKRCKIEKYSFDEPGGCKTYSLKDLNWFIEFEILDNEKIKVISNNVEGESEISIVLKQDFTIGDEFTKNNIQDFIGTWNSSYAYVYDEGLQEYIKVENLKHIFGSSYLEIRKQFYFKGRWFF